VGADAFPGAPRSKHRQEDPNGLTKRQRQVFDYKAQGKSDKRIAELLKLSRRTVQAHWQQAKGFFQKSKP
jgi:DNA-binding NarL/FixJ family response regulator